MNNSFKHTFDRWRECYFDELRKYLDFNDRKSVIHIYLNVKFHVNKRLAT